MFQKKLLFLILCFFTGVLAYPHHSQASPQNPPAKNTNKDPCPGEGTQYEMNQCMARHHEDADRRLNELYARIERALEGQLKDARDSKHADQVRYEEQGLANLRATAKAWTAYRYTACEAARQRYEGGSIAPMIYSDCMWRTTEHRIEELDGTYHDDLENK